MRKILILLSIISFLSVSMNKAAEGKEEIKRTSEGSDETPKRSGEPKEEKKEEKGFYTITNKSDKGILTIMEPPKGGMGLGEYYKLDKDGIAQLTLGKEYSVSLMDKASLYDNPRFLLKGNIRNNILEFPSRDLKIILFKNKKVIIADQ